MDIQVVFNRKMSRSMKTNKLKSLSLIALTAVCSLISFSSCSGDANSSRGKGLRFIISQEQFGNNGATRSGGVLHCESIDLGDGLVMHMSIQEDVEASDKIATRALETGEYTIMCYNAAGDSYAGQTSGTVT